MKFFNSVFPYTNNASQHEINENKQQPGEFEKNEIRTRSGRQVHKPSWLNDYILATATIK